MRYDYYILIDTILFGSLAWCSMGGSHHHASGTCQSNPLVSDSPKHQRICGLDRVCLFVSVCFLDVLQLIQFRQILC